MPGDNGHGVLVRLLQDPRAAGEGCRQLDLSAHRMRRIVAVHVVCQSLPRIGSEQCLMLPPEPDPVGFHASVGVYGKLLQ